MEFEEVVRKRRMVRRYDKSKPVAREQIERIAALAQKAPSAGFSQGQRLVIVTDPARRAKVAEICDEPAYMAHGFDAWISDAAALFVPMVSEQIYHRRYQEPDKIQDDGTEINWPIPYWWTDVGATALLIHRAAIDEGLACGFLGLEDYSELKRYLGIPDEMMPIGVVTVGYPLPDQRSGSLKRGWVAPDEFAHWEQW